MRKSALLVGLGLSLGISPACTEGGSGTPLPVDAGLDVSFSTGRMTGAGQQDTGGSYTAGQNDSQPSGGTVSGAGTVEADTGAGGAGSGGSTAGTMGSAGAGSMEGDSGDAGQTATEGETDPTEEPSSQDAGMEESSEEEADAGEGEPMADAGEGEPMADAGAEDAGENMGEGTGAEDAGLDDAGVEDAGAEDLPPTLSMETAPTTVLDCGAVFEPLELSATDDVDGDLAVEVAGADAVVTSEPGLFTVIYSATDSAGQSTELEQVVNICGDSCGESGKTAIDLSGWQVTQYENDNQPDARWVLAEDSLSVEQTVNADASIYFSDFDATDLAVEGTWRMTGGADDDFVGFVFGYKDRGHFYLFDWKRGTQNYDGEVANAGMTLKVVEAAGDPADLQLGYADLWDSEGSENVRILSDDMGTALHNDIAWNFDEDYTFFLEFHAGSFRIDVLDGAGTELESWSVVDDTYTSGRFGFYNFSQGPVTYQGFEKRTTPSACSTVVE